MAAEGSGHPLDSAGDLQIAVAAILVEAARMDDHFDKAERDAILRLLSERFSLTPEQAGVLLASAETAVDRSTQLFRFTEAIVRRLDAAERERIVEMMWEVAYADGTLSAQEDALIRRIAALVYVDDAGRMAARRRVRLRLGLER